MRKLLALVILCGIALSKVRGDSRRAARSLSITLAVFLVKCFRRARGWLRCLLQRPPPPLAVLFHRL
jgi:hypothetical protein